MLFVQVITAGAFNWVGHGGLSPFNDAMMKTAGIGRKIAKVVAHGVVGGASQLAQGGKFAAGFFSAGFTQATSLSGRIFNSSGGVGNIFKAAIIGGTASAIGGGKFANGAVTGAFLMAFNHGAGDTQTETEPDLFKDLGGLISDPSKYFQCTIDCAAEVFGVGTATKTAVAVSGINFLSVPGKSTLATPGTSLSSKIFRKLFNNRRFSRPVRAPTLKLGLSARTIKVGAFVGRVVPIIGTVSLFPDARRLDFCTATCIRPGE